MLVHEQIGQKHSEDPRLAAFKKEWFEGKDCLDIGCNQGLITISVGILSLSLSLSNTYTYTHWDWHFLFESSVLCKCGLKEMHNMPQSWKPLCKILNQ